MEFTARVRMDCAHAVRQCMEAVEILYLACGGSGIAETNTISVLQPYARTRARKGCNTLRANSAIARWAEK